MAWVAGQRRVGLWVDGRRGVAVGDSPPTLGCSFFYVCIKNENYARGGGFPALVNG